MTVLYTVAMGKPIRIKMEELIPVLSSDFHIHTMIHMLTHRHTTINNFNGLHKVVPISHACSDTCTYIHDAHERTMEVLNVKEYVTLFIVKSKCPVVGVV